jgi:ABC-type branched-chain amino acid transport systems, ATPase component
MPHMLEITDLNYSYGSIHVLKGLSCYVDEGEIVTLVGSNGAGKSTTMRTISGLNDSRGASGSIMFTGKEILKTDGNRIARMGLSQVLEGRHIFPQLTVYENLHVGAYIRKDKDIKADIQKMYKRFPRLEERKSQMGETLSGGEQQMLAIARALMSRPKLLLLDEPSLGLAPIIVREIFEAIRETANDGTTILFVEQNTRVALNVADRGYVMQLGEIALHDSCENLLNNDDVKRIYLGA